MATLKYVIEEQQFSDGKHYSVTVYDGNDVVYTTTGAPPTDPNVELNNAKSQLKSEGDFTDSEINGMTPKSTTTTTTTNTTPPVSPSSTSNFPTGTTVGTTNISGNKTEITKERYDEIKNKEVKDSGLSVYEEVDVQEDADEMIADSQFVDEAVVESQDTDFGYTYNPNDSYVYTAPDNSKYVDKSAPVGNTTVSGGKPYSGSGVSTNCSDIVKNFNKNLKISRHFTLGEVAVYFDRLVDKTVQCKRNGKKEPVQFSKYMLACNLKALAVNVLDKIKDQFPDMEINSTIRNWGAGSEHETGQACDMRFTKHLKKDYINIVTWINQNCPCNQLFLEYRPSENPKGGWIHVSYADPKNTTYGANKTIGSLYNDDGKRSPGSLGSFNNILANSNWA